MGVPSKKWDPSSVDFLLFRVVPWFLCFPLGIPLASSKFYNGCKTGVRCTRRRLTLWAAGAYATLLSDLDQDTARASLRDATRQARSATASADSVTRRAIRLIGIGEVSRGVNLLTSHGLVDVNTEGVREQLLAKHPSRCDALSEAALAFSDAGDSSWCGPLCPPSHRQIGDCAGRFRATQRAHGRAEPPHP